MQRSIELRIGLESHDLVLAVYRATAGLPADERDGLSCRLRRTALSVATHIVEGWRRVGRADIARSMNLAEASLAETQYLLIVCLDLGYLAPSVIDPLSRAAYRIAGMAQAIRSFTAGDANPLQPIPDLPDLEEERTGEFSATAPHAGTSSAPTARAGGVGAAGSHPDDTAELKPPLPPFPTRAGDACRARSRRRR